MKIQIEDKIYTLTDQSIQAILGSIEHFVADQYDKLPSTTKLAAMATVRAMLGYAESKETDPEKRKMIRPVKGTDPAMHLIRLLLKGVGEALPNVECEIATEDNNISNFSFQYAGKSRGQVSADGNVGERKDNSRQIIGPEAS